MNTIINLLMTRDGISHDEAEASLNSAINRMEECDYEIYECEDIMLEELGLEMDYIDYILDLAY